MKSTLAERLSNYGADLKFDALPAAAVHEAKRRILDSLGCAFGAWHADPCVIARKVASRITGAPGATLFGLKHRSSPDWAAFANGCLVRYLDYNDTYLSKEPAHPSDNIPAALAVAETVGAGGRDIITAIIAAYEVQCRFCDATSIRAIGWDHVTYGAFSVALASSMLMKLDRAKTRHALGIAGVAAANMRQTRVGELSHWKGCAFANAARHGVYAAMLAAEGMTGPSPIFEGTMGFEKLVSGPLPAKGPFAEDARLDSMYDCMITKTSIKCWPAEYHSQSAVEAALSIRPEIGNIADVEAVIVESHDASVDIIGSEKEKWFPENRETADHSLPYITAAALVDGKITMEQFSPARISDKKLIDFVQKVEVRRNSELSSIYPNAVANIVTVKLKGGRTLSKRVDFPTGNNNNPMSDELVQNKFHLQADPLVGKERADRIASYVMGIEKVANLNELWGLIEVPESARKSG